MTRASRLEFTKPVKLEIFRRAGGPGNPCCEKCKLSVKSKRFDYDHVLECWEMEDVTHGYRAPLTASDGQLLCGPCHDDKTGRKSGERAHGVRIVEKLARINRRESASFTRHGSTLRKKLNGDIIDKYTGEVVRKGRR
jgi:hypothetical protein